MERGNFPGKLLTTMEIKSELLSTFKLDGTEMIFDCQFHPSQSWVAFATVEGDVKIIDIASSDKKVVKDFPKHHNKASLRKVRFHDQYMMTVAKTIKITDLNTEKVLRKIVNGKKSIYSLVVADDYLLAFGDDDGRFRVFDYRVDRGDVAHFEAHDCDQFISDLDIDSNLRTVVASSGEGTLTAYNIRAKKMEYPQSELFESGFQCVRLLETKGKAVVGTEDGVLNLFNKGEWGNISDRFPIQQNNTGTGSIECMEVLQDDNEGTAIVFGSSDGNLSAASLFPHHNLGVLTKNSEQLHTGIEALDVNQITKRIVSVAENEVKYLSYELSRVDQAGGSNKRARRNEFFSGLET